MGSTSRQITTALYNVFWHVGRFNSEKLDVFVIPIELHTVTTLRGQRGLRVMQTCFSFSELQIIQQLYANCFSFLPSRCD